MCEQVFLLCVLTLWRIALGNISGKNCDDCTSIPSCKAATNLIHKNESDADDQLREAFCGFGNDKLPKVCCSMLSSDEPSSPVPGEDSIDNHPNLRLLPNTCSVNVPKKTLGGLTAELYEYPWMALIAYKSSEGLRFKCSGSLINERYVLTAAHCITKQIAGVRIGEFDLETATDCQGEEPSLICETHTQDLHTEEAIAHPGYQSESSFKNDIALIRLKKPVDLTFKNAKAICLPVTKDLQDRNVSGLYATIAGWGFTESVYMSSKLQAIDVLIHTRVNCSAAFNKWPVDSIDFTDKLCAGGYGRSTRVGDDGPLMVGGPYKNLYRIVQYGIFSFGGQIKGPGAPTVYTDVRKHMKWILDTIKP